MKCWPIGKQYFEIWIDFFYQIFRINNRGRKPWPYHLDPKLQAEHGENLAEFLALDLNKDGILSLDEYAQARLAPEKDVVTGAGEEIDTGAFGEIV